MSVPEIIEQIKALSAAERAQVAKFVVEQDDSWVPDLFKRGMADAAAGRFVDMEAVLSGAPHLSCRRKSDRPRRLRVGQPVARSGDLAPNSALALCA